MRDILSDPSKIEFYSDPNPMKRAQKQMLTPAVKRFYKDVSVSGQGGQFLVLLDGKPVKTPARKDLAFPKEQAAQLVAKEFSDQETEIIPAKMPFTRLANTAIDGVANEIDAVLEDIKRFCGNDLICYRADGPDKLVLRQTDAWDKYLDWVRGKHGVRLKMTEGIMHVDQSDESIQAFGAALVSYGDAISLACVHAMTTLTGSAVMALAVADGFVAHDQAWTDAHVDEDWTIENWGSDAEAMQRRANRWIDMNAAAMLLRAVRGG
ncbi:MAG: ATP12 family chaperone protein [Rhizobiaceae bacterium]